jgi:NADPH2:quinone reductase
VGKSAGRKTDRHRGQCQKSARAAAGAWQVINYREESIVERLKEITSGKKVRVVYDSVGKETLGSVAGLPAASWADGELRECVRRSHRRESGILNQKGSLYVTRPSLQGYITNREELEEASNELFSLIASGVIKVDVAEAQKYPLADAQRAHEVLESRATQGSSLLIP